MGAFNPMAGKNAAVLIGSTSYAFDKWEFDMSTTLPDVSNFTGGGYVQRTVGLVDGKVTLSGPYDEGNMPFAINTSYSLILSWNGSITLTGTALLQDIKSSQDVKDAGRVSLVFMTNGSFGSSIV